MEETVNRNYTVIENNNKSANSKIIAFAYRQNSYDGKIVVKKNYVGKEYWIKIYYKRFGDFIDENNVYHWYDILDCTPVLNDEEIECIKDFISDDKEALKMFSDYEKNKGKSYDKSTEDYSDFKSSK